MKEKKSQVEENMINAAQWVLKLARDNGAKKHSTREIYVFKLNEHMKQYMKDNIGREYNYGMVMMYRGDVCTLQFCHKHSPTISYAEPHTAMNLMLTLQKVTREKYAENGTQLV